MRTRRPRTRENHVTDPHPHPRRRPRPAPHRLGVIEVLANRLSFIACGTVFSDDNEELAHRLLELHTGLTEVVTRFEPDEAAVEKTFVNKDATATLKLGQARGIAMLVPARPASPSTNMHQTWSRRPWWAPAMPTRSRSA